MMENTLESRLEIIKILIKLGASLDSRNGRGLTPLDCAVERSDLPVVKLLLDSGADLDRACGSRGRYERETTLHLAVVNSSLETLRILIEYGADVNIQDRNGETPIMKAAKAGRTDVLEVLKSSGAEVSVRDRDGWTALFWAVWKNKEGAVAWLLAEGKSDPNLKDSYSKTPLHIAIQRGCKGIIHTLTINGADPSFIDD